MILKSVYLNCNSIFLIAKNQRLAKCIQYFSINQIDKILNSNERINVKNQYIN